MWESWRSREVKTVICGGQAEETEYLEYFPFMQK